jgi:hypothetical protein
LGAKVPAASASRFPNGRLKLSMRPPPAAAPASKNLRRERPFVDGGRPDLAALEVR